MVAAVPSEPAAPRAVPSLQATVDVRVAVADAAGQHELLTVRLDGRSLARILRWEVDPDYDGLVFRPVRPEAGVDGHGDGDPALDGRAATFSVAAHDGPRTVCVRAVDLDGVGSECIIALPSRGFP